MKYAIALAASFFSSAVDRELMEPMPTRTEWLHTRSSRTGQLVQSIMGIEVELKYEVDGNKIKIGSRKVPSSLLCSMMGRSRAPWGLVLTKLYKK